MRILHIFYNYGSFILNQIREENKAGLESSGIHYLLSRRTTIPQLDDSIDIINGRSILRGNLFAQYRIKRSEKDVLRLIKLKNPDLIYSHITCLDGQYALAAKKKYGIPYVTAVRNTDIHGEHWNNKSQKKLFINILVEADIIYMLCAAYREKLLDKLPSEYRDIIESKIKITSNGVDEKWLRAEIQKRIVSKSGKIRIITAGDICKNKGQDCVCKAINKLLPEGYDIHYTVVGKNKDNSLYRYLCQFNFIDIREYLPFDQLIPLYSQCDLFIMVSQKETFGIVYPEALSMGLPIIYNKSEGFGGRYKDGFVGYGVDYGDIDQLCNAIKEIMSDYDSISKRCIQESKNYSWQRIVMSYEEDYKRIVY